jgi:hypothetical protein
LFYLKTFRKIPIGVINYTPAMGRMGGTFSKYLMGWVGWVFLFNGMDGMGQKFYFRFNGMGGMGFFI